TPTVLVPGVTLARGDVVEVTGDAYRHFFRARRFGVGERVRVTDGRGSARFGRIDRVERDVAVVLLDDPAPALESELRLTLAAAAIRPERASWIVEKGTELGVDRFLWFSSERSQRELRSQAMERLRRVARSALEQSGRSRLPEVSATSWTDLLESVASTSAVLLDIQSPDMSRSPLDLAGDCAERIRSVPAPLLLLGPEGGFTTAERDQLIEAGAHPLWLGPRVLRAETAAVVGAGLLLGSGNN
ncbi:MAG: RsmE family RNA methyltransferase, partial [Acidobacteriota bacterium]